MPRDDDEINYELVIREKRQDTSALKSILQQLFSGVGLVVLCILIAIFGATAYIGLEQEYDEKLYADKQDAARQVRDAQLYLVNIFWEYATNIDRFNYTEEAFNNKTEDDLKLFISYVINATRDYKYDGEIEGWEFFWHQDQFPKALLFTITIMTTIGYGHIYPRTLEGQLFTIVYSLVAMGITLVMLANVGAALADALIYSYSRICCRWFRSARVKSEIPSRSMRKIMRRRLVDDEIGDESFMPTNSIAIPIIVNILIIAGYVGVGAVVFSAWEGWSTMAAAYFSFVTLTTIGLGDLSPLNTFTAIGKPDAGFTEYINMMFATFYCAVGLALVSMCISLIQEQVARQAALMAGSKDEVIELDVIEIVPRRKKFLRDG